MPKNVTFIDDLFDANSLMSDDYIEKDNLERDSYTNQVMTRHIRKQNDNSQYLLAMNGGSYSSPQPKIHHQHQLQHIPHHQHQLQHIPQPQYIQQPYYDQQELSCMTIANHIKECPICSKFYNCDNSLYIICIVLLIIICIILLKRIIEKA
jgi:hypothetical protein